LFITTASDPQIFAGDEPLISIKPASDDTGTMHYAEVQELRQGEGLPAVIKTDVERGILAPEKVLLSKKISTTESIIFGFSSLGGGNETLHAILIKYDKQRTQISDHLQMHVRRGAGGFLWSNEGELFLVTPSERLDDEDVFLESSRIVLKYGPFKSFKLGDEPKNAIFIGSPMSPREPIHQSAALIPIANGCFDLSVFSKASSSEKHLTMRWSEQRAASPFAFEMAITLSLRAMSHSARCCSPYSR
jgi:hypothetical protein